MLLFASPKKQAAYEYLHKNKTGNRVQITYSQIAIEIGGTPQNARKIILQLQSEGYLKIISSSYGTLIELKAAVAI